MSTRNPPARKLPHFDLVDLRLFLDIAESNSLTRGAARSCLSLFAASGRVKALERDLGSQLLERGKSGVTLTASGQALPYHRDRLVLAVPRSHRLATARSVDFLDTLDEDHVGLNASSAIHDFLNGVVTAAGRRLRVRVEVGSFDAMCRMIGARVGIGVMPESAARRHMRSAGIRTVALSNDWAVRDLEIVVRDRTAPPGFARKLVDALAASSQ